MRPYLLAFSLGLVISVAQAQVAVVTPHSTEKGTFPVTAWLSKSSADPVSINNGAGVPVLINITVAPSLSDPAPGITLQNCGHTTRLEAGSSTICVNSDAQHPVIIAADGVTPVSGTYQIQIR